MKRKFVERFALGLLVLVAIFATGSLFAAPVVAGGYMMAGGVAGTTTTDAVEEAAPGLNMESVLESIVMISPARTPMTILLNKFGKKAKSTDWVQKGYELTERPYEDTTAALYTTQTGVKSAQLTVTNPDLWTKDHTMLIQLGSDPSAFPMVLITLVDRPTKKVTITSIDPDGSNSTVPDLPTIPSGTKITRLGAALSELQANMGSFSEMPSKDFNHNQRFGVKVSTSFFQELEKKQVKWGFADIRALRLKTMREEEEITALIGKRGITFRANGNNEQERVYTMNGVIRGAGVKKGTYGTGGTDRTFDAAALNKLCESVFAGNNGSSVRYALHGSKVATYLANDIKDWTRTVSENKNEIVSGLFFSSHKSTFGELRFIYHPLLDKIGMSECMFILDLENLVQCEFKALESIDLKLKEAGISNEKAVFIDHTWTVLSLHDECNMLVTPKS